MRISKTWSQFEALCEKVIEINGKELRNCNEGYDKFVKMIGMFFKNFLRLFNLSCKVGLKSKKPYYCNSI